MDLKITRVEANEIAKSADFEYAHDREYGNLCTIFQELFARTSNDLIVGGLVCQERGTPSMNVNLSIGLAYCINTGKIAHSGSLFGPISIIDGGAQDRIDLVEVRLKETDYDEQQRAVKDPVTGDITYQDINTKTRFELEAQAIEGVEGAGVAKTRTGGWIKIAEILVEAGENISILDADIRNCTGGYDGEETTAWTAQTNCSFRLKEIAEFKKIFRTKHKENGDHVDGVIKDQHIDFGTGANQVSAIDVPIADAGSLLDATEIENALQEIANARIPIGSTIGWLPGYFTNGSNGGYTGVSISLTDNYKECNGAALNDADSPIYNGAGRYLPNITDDRFLMGNTSPGGIGGDNNAMAHTHGFTQPSAHGITQPTFTFPDHKHKTMEKGPGTMGVTIYYGFSSGGSLKQLSDSMFLVPEGVNPITIWNYYTDSYIFYTKTDGGGSCSRTQNVILTNNHSGGAVNAVSESRTDKNLSKYLACKYIQRTK